MRGALVAALMVRVTQALTIRTAFAPDEFWQSVEVAHRLVFGYGHLTWEWAAGLRSYAHPLLFAAPYALLKLLRLDSAWAVVRAPMLLQAPCAAATDVYVARLATLVLGQQAGRWCLVCQLASWFNGYCLVRTYSNSLEALAAAAGMYHWLCSRDTVTGDRVSRSSGSRNDSSSSSVTKRLHQRAWIACAALSFVFRPSSAMFWALPAVLEICRQRRHGAWLLLLDAASVGGGLLGAAALVDRAGYGRWVAVPWEFLRFNLLAGASAHYGRHPWHWNLSQGLPTVAASLLPLMAAGLLLCVRAGRQLQLAGLAAWSMATYSLPAHKEFRFLLPALQLLMPYCGLAAADLLGGCSSRQAQAGRNQTQKQLASSGPPNRHQHSRLWRWGAAACILLQLPIAAYFMLVHQGAQVGIMHLIRREAAAVGGSGTSVLFLTPCHATPYYSHVHRTIPMRFLDCSPPQHAAATALLNQRSEAWLALPQACPAAPASVPLSQRQCFERDPATYLGSVLGSMLPSQRPHLLVGYVALMQQLAGPLAAWGYRLHASLTNCWVQTDDDNPCQLQLWSL